MQSMIPMGNDIKDLYIKIQNRAPGKAEEVLAIFQQNQLDTGVLLNDADYLLDRINAVLSGALDD
eukprot:UN00516